jgi:aspartate aminotransferase
LRSSPARSAAPGHLARILEQHSRRGLSVPAGDVVLLDSGDPDFPTPREIVDSLQEALAGGATHYSEPFGDPELRERLAAIEDARCAWTVEQSQVVITHGASGGLSASILASLDPGDRVLIPEPTYSLYADHVRLAGAEPQFVPTTADFHLDLDALEAAAGGARMLILCNPCNPTGAVFTVNELESVGRLADQHDLLVVSDEAYDSIVYPPTRFCTALAVPALARRLIYCQTFSKRYAMTGWRLGYIVAPEPLATAAGRIHFSLHGPLNAAVQRAGITAAGSPALPVEGYVARRQRIVERLSAVSGVKIRPPEGTFYAFFRYPGDEDSMSMQERCLEYGVALRAGSEFGDAGEGHLRLSFTAPPDVLEEGLSRLKSVFATL